MKVHHIAIRASSVTELARFYLEVLGLPRIEAPRAGVAWFDLGGTILMLEPEGGGSLEPEDAIARDTKGRLAVIALEMQLEERARWRARLETAGVVIHAESAYSFYFRDPEGNPLALSHYPSRYGP